MSWNPALEPGCPDEIGIDAIETLIVPRAHDLGGFEVQRALPSPKRQMVGPFVFFDQAGPAEFVTGKGIDVRPHPRGSSVCLSSFWGFLKWISAWVTLPPIPASAG